MIKLDALLPELERSVADRVESPTLRKMGPDDLRDLVHKLIERQQWLARDPTLHFAELVETAIERHADLRDTKERSIEVRTEILRQLIVTLRPALPALLGSIVVQMQRPPDEHSQRTHHPYLVGFELLNGEKQGPVGPDTVAISGRSWWIVGLAPEGPDARIEPRYAVAKHSGTLGNDGAGVAHTTIELTTTQYAASQIRDVVFPGVLERVHKRLVALGGRKLTKNTDAMLAASDRLAAALDALARADP